MKRSLTLILGIILATTMAMPGMASAKSKIAYTTTNSNTWLTETLYTMNQNGNNIKRIRSARAFDRLAFALAGSKDLAFSYKSLKKKYHLAILNGSGNIYRCIRLQSWTGGPSWYDGKVIFGVYYDGIFQYDPVADQKSRIMYTCGLTYDHNPVVAGDNLYFNHSEWCYHCYNLCLPNWTQYIDNPITGPEWSLKKPIKPPPKPFVRIMSNINSGDEDIHLQYSGRTRVLVCSSSYGRGKIRYKVKGGKTRTLKLPSGTLNITHAYLSNGGKKIAYGTNNGIFITSLVGKITTRKVSDMCIVEDWWEADRIAWSPKDRCLVVGNRYGLYLVGALSKRCTHQILKTSYNRCIEKVAWSH